MSSFLGNLGFAEWMIGIGAICSVVGTILLGVRQGKEQLEIKDQIITEQRNLVTGGEGYFFVRPSRVAGTNEVILLTEFKGNYPIYDLSIQVEEYDRMLNGQSYAYMRSATYSVQMGTVHPLASNSIFKQIILPSNGFSEFGKRYYLKISSRNGFVEEDIYLRGTNQGYAQAFKVVQFLPKYGNSSMGSIERIEARVKNVDLLFPMQDVDHLKGDSGWERDYQSN